MEFVCPKPYVWSKIYHRLLNVWEETESQDDEPPKPLILAAWTTCSDYDKNDQWKKTILWAKDRNLSHLVPDLSPDECYYVEALSHDVIDDFTNYTYHEPKERPTDKDAERALQRLREKWNLLFSTELASATYPLTFTGKKLRCLLVWADEKYTPPWGGWKHIDHLNQKKFTKFRQKINDTIAPVFVDHIDFTCSVAKRRRFADY